MNCDMCGKSASLYTVEVEGSRMKLCEACSKFGKVVARPQVIVKKKKNDDSIKSFLPDRPEILQIIVPDYGMRIKTKREKLNLTQKELGIKISVRESLLHNIESGHFEPPIDIARKFEKFLNIKLVDEVIDDKPVMVHQKGQALTLGDMVKIRKR